MTVRRSLAAALRDLYENSVRLALLNLALAALVCAALVAAAYAQPGALLLVAAGPFAAALMHCAVTLQQTDELRLADGLAGLRLHWRRGLALGALVAAAALLTVVAVSFYAPRALPVAAVAVSVALVFAVWQVHVWPLAVSSRRSRLRDVLREAGASFARRPAASAGLALALLLVNAVGAIGVLPVLTVTVAYSALATAHFVLPPPTQEATI
jgi:hypothetical protein